MWELYLAVAIFTVVYGLIKIGTGLESSDTDFESYDRLQNTGIALMKYLFILLAIGTLWMGLAITPQVIELSQSEDRCEVVMLEEIDIAVGGETNKTFTYGVECKDYTNTTQLNTTARSNVNEMTDNFSWAISASWITWIILGLVFFISFFLIAYTDVFTKLFVGKGRRK